MRALSKSHQGKEYEKWKIRGDRGKIKRKLTEVNTWAASR